VSIGTVFTKVTWVALVEKLANLSLIIVIRDVEHLHLDLDWKRIIFLPELLLAVSEVT